MCVIAQTNKHSCHIIRIFLYKSQHVTIEPLNVWLNRSREGCGRRCVMIQNKVICASTTYKRSQIKLWVHVLSKADDYPMITTAIWTLQYQ